MHNKEACWLQFFIFFSVKWIHMSWIKPFIHCRGDVSCRIFCRGNCQSAVWLYLTFKLTTIAFTLNDLFVSKQVEFWFNFHGQIFAMTFCVLFRCRQLDRTWCCSKDLNFHLVWLLCDWFYSIFHYTHFILHFDFFFKSVSFNYFWQQILVYFFYFFFLCFILVAIKILH